jgi:hypothetical protein
MSETVTPLPKSSPVKVPAVIDRRLGENKIVGCLDLDLATSARARGHCHQPVGTAGANDKGVGTGGAGRLVDKGNLRAKRHSHYRRRAYGTGCVTDWNNPGGFISM